MLAKGEINMVEYCKSLKDVKAWKIMVIQELAVIRKL